MMRQLVLAMTAAASLVGGGALLLETAGAQDEAPPPPRRVIVGLDLSLSNPLIADPAFAAKVGGRIAGELRTLGFGSEVHVRTFGNYDATSNTFAYDAVLSVRERPQNVADDVGRLIAATPLLVKQGKWRGQGRTNILAFLDNLSHSPGCQGLPTTIVLATDGIEDSVYARLDYPSSHLPKPEGRPFRGCYELEILGLGQGTRSPLKTTRLRAEWQGWADAAGFQHFVALNDW
jgi:hypothetical protein